MSISITTTPNADVAAYAPVTIAGTSTRNPFEGGVRDYRTITGMSNSGGYLMLTVAIQAWEDDDTILIDNATTDFEQYNGRHTITSRTSTTITTATTWVAASTGDEGIVFRMNENLYIKLEVENDASTVIGTLYCLVDTSDDTWSFDISRPLQYELSSYFSLVDGEVDTGSASHEYTLVLYETWQADDYTTTEEVHGTEPTTISHLTTELPSDDNFQCTDFFYKDTFLICYYNDTSNDLRFKIEAEGRTEYTAVIVGTNGHYAFADTVSDEWVKVTAQEDSGGWADLSDTIIIKAVGCGSTILHYINRFGMYVGYECHSWDDNQRTIKVDKYTGETWQERTLKGKEYSNAVYQDIRDVVASNEVYDEDLAEVRVLTDAILYKADEVSPKIKIRYDETFIS